MKINHVIIFVLQTSGVDNDGIEFETECFDVLGQSHHKFLTLRTKMKNTPLTFFWRKRVAAKENHSVFDQRNASIIIVIRFTFTHTQISANKSYGLGSVCLLGIHNEVFLQSKGKCLGLWRLRTDMLLLSHVLSSYVDFHHPNSLLSPKSAEVNFCLVFSCCNQR